MVIPHPIDTDSLYFQIAFRDIGDRSYRTSSYLIINLFQYNSVHKEYIGVAWRLGEVFILGGDVQLTQQESSNIQKIAMSRPPENGVIRECQILEDRMKQGLH